MVLASNAKRKISQIPHKRAVDITRLGLAWLLFQCEHVWNSSQDVAVVLVTPIQSLFRDISLRVACIRHVKRFHDIIE